MKDKLSAHQAIRVGTWVINLPVGLLISVLSTVGLTLMPLSPWYALLSPLGIALAWLWWSLSVPCWRLWAYECVENIGEFKKAAVDAKLVWPDGHFFERTEIKSKAHLAREHVLEKSRA